MRGQRHDKVSCLWPIGLRVQNLHQAPEMSSAVTGQCALEGRAAPFPGWRCLNGHVVLNPASTVAGGRKFLARSGLSF